MKTFILTIVTSLLASVISILIIFAYPGSVSVPGTRIGPSPYMAELNQLHEQTKGGLNGESPVWDRIDVLRKKNKEWFAEKEKLQKEPKIVAEAFSEFITIKSSKAAPILAILWALSFFFMAKNNVKNMHLLMVAFPTALFATKFFSFFAWVLVTLAILAVFIYLQVYNGRETENVT